MAVFESIDGKNIDNIASCRGYEECRSLITLHIPANTPIRSVLTELTYEIKRIEKRRSKDDTERNMLISLMGELITDLKEIGPVTGSVGTIIFFGLNETNDKLKSRYTPAENSRIEEFLLVCDRKFYLDTDLVHLE